MKLLYRALGEAKPRISVFEKWIVSSSYHPNKLANFDFDERKNKEWHCPIPDLSDYPG